MEMVTAALGALAAIPGLVSSFVNLFNSGADREQIQRAIKEQYKVEIPNIDDLMVKAHTAQAEPEVQNGETRAQQLDALRQMSDVADKGGFNDSALNTLSQVEGRVGQDRAGLNAASTNDLRRRGMLGSGLEVSRQGQAIQDATNQLSSAGSQAAADAQKRALQAISDKAGIAGDARTADERVAEANRQAAIERDRFNAGVLNSTDQFNSNQRINRTNLEQNRANGITNAATGGSQANSKSAEVAQKSADHISDTLGTGADYANKKVKK